MPATDAAVSPPPQRRAPSRAPHVTAPDSRRLVHNTKLRELFDKHDADKSGGLQPDQLLALLTDVAESDSKHRYKHAEEADVEFVMGRCDKEGDGVISFDELGPAIATWKEAARNVAPEPSSACVLL